MGQWGNTTERNNTKVTQKNGTTRSRNEVNTQEKWSRKSGTDMAQTLEGYLGNLGIHTHEMLKVEHNAIARKRWAYQAEKKGATLGGRNWETHSQTHTP